VISWSSMGSSSVGWWAAGCVGADCCAAVMLVVSFSLFVCCCCHVGCLLLFAGGLLGFFSFLFIVVAMWGVSCLRQEGIGGKKQVEKTQKKHASPSE
jgi:UPF0716 family protein affecting phage T7 exclusion